MSSLWPRIFKAFRRPWRIVRREGGALWIEAAAGRVVLYVYRRHNDVWNHKLPTDDEAHDIVRAIAKVARRRHRPEGELLGAAGEAAPLAVGTVKISAFTR
jgi:hypothetical protein